VAEDMTPEQLAIRDKRQAVREIEAREEHARRAARRTARPRRSDAASADAHTRRHTQRLTGAWWFKVVGVAPLGLAAVALVLMGAFWGHNLHTYLGYLLAAGAAAAFAYLGWRKAGLLGGLLAAYAPVGAFLALLGTGR
jgi:hypothetical protein